MNKTKIITSSFLMEINEDAADFLRMITNNKDLQEAAEFFGVACVSYCLDPVEILERVMNLNPAFIFIGESNE